MVNKTVAIYVFFDDISKSMNHKVRKGHVKTDEHWTRNWMRAKLLWEMEYGKEDKL